MIDFFQYLSSGLLMGGMYAIIGVTIVLVYKSTHVASLAHGQILAFGAVFFYIFFGVLKWPLLASFSSALILGGILGFLINRLTMRRLIGEPLFTCFLMTFAVFMFLDGVFNLYVGGETRFIPAYLPEGTIDIGGVCIAKDRLGNFFISMLPIMILIVLFKYSKIGLRMRATAENHTLAQGSGIRVKKVFMLIWVVSSIMAAIGGIVCAGTINIHFPLPGIGLKGLVIALVGGLDSFAGAIVAGLMVGILESMGAGYIDPLIPGGGVNEVVAYVMLLIVLLVKPYGLLGLARIERI